MAPFGVPLLIGRRAPDSLAPSPALDAAARLRMLSQLKTAGLRATDSVEEGPAVGFVEGIAAGVGLTSSPRVWLSVARAKVRGMRKRSTVEAPPVPWEAEAAALSRQ